MMGFVTFNDVAEQYLCAAVLRPGNVTAAAGAVGIVRRLMALVRNSFPEVRIRVRQTRCWSAAVCASDERIFTHIRR
jgi:hypothetical protein